MDLTHGSGVPPVDPPVRWSRRIARYRVTSVPRRPRSQPRPLSPNGPFSDGYEKFFTAPRPHLVPPPVPGTHV